MTFSNQLLTVSRITQNRHTSSVTVFRSKYTLCSWMKNPSLFGWFSLYYKRLRMDLSKRRSRNRPIMQLVRPKPRWKPTRSDIEWFEGKFQQFRGESRTSLDRCQGYICHYFRKFQGTIGTLYSCESINALIIIMSVFIIVCLTFEKVVSLCCLFFSEANWYE